MRTLSPALTAEMGASMPGMAPPPPGRIVSSARPLLVWRGRLVFACTVAGWGGDGGDADDGLSSLAFLNRPNLCGWRGGDCGSGFWSFLERSATPSLPSRRLRSVSSASRRAWALSCSAWVSAAWSASRRAFFSARSWAWTRFWRSASSCISWRASARPMAAALACSSGARRGGDERWGWGCTAGELAARERDDGTAAAVGGARPGGGSGTGGGCSSVFARWSGRWRW